MYDFYFGNTQHIQQNEEDYLIFVKRMLPRWCNSIPDSEYLAIHDLLSKHTLQKNSCFVETGSGASTLVLLYHAIKNNTVLYSWDINPSKGAFLRSVMNDTFGRSFEKNLWKHWKFVPYSSTSEQLGISILKELNTKIDFCFLDSEHTAKVLLKELELVNPQLNEGAIVAIDDANYSYEHTNIAYINMQRKKLGLGAVEDPSDNQGKCFWERTEAYLKEEWHSVSYLEDNYKKNYQNDLFWPYFSADRQAMGAQGMEKTDNLEHRFDAWQVKDKVESKICLSV